MFWIARLACFICRFLLCLRYRVKVVGDTYRPSKRGTLILANHPALIDPVLLTSYLWPKSRFHGVGAETLEHNKIVNFFLKPFGTLFVPVFDFSSNSYKQHRIKQSYQQIVSLLKKGESVLFYPAGSLKISGEERLGGASGLHHILEQYPTVDILLVRTQGLWGSQFSKALGGKTPDIVSVFLRGLKILFKNGLFFTPRRRVTVECHYADVDFPRYCDKRVLNTYLENWYNKDGPEPLTLISYSCLGVVLPTVYQKSKIPKINFDSISNQVHDRVIHEIAQLTPVKQDEIKAEHDLSLDLGLDSLDRSQIALFLKESFGILNVQISQLTTVGTVLGIASKVISVEEKEQDNVEIKTPDWLQTAGRPIIEYPSCGSLIEGFLMTADRMGEWVAGVDENIGEITYKRLKFAIIFFANQIRKMDEKHIGILLPASIASNIVILATMLAGKTPVMINWTLGGRNLKSIIEQTKLKVTISSWRFLDQLDNADLDGLENQIVTLESIKKKSTLGSKIKSKILSRRKKDLILKYFGQDQLSGDETAVILFTSGTESFPKGVPLTHRNIIENQKAALSYFLLNEEDAILSFLPPFHSFGFSITGTMPLIAGWRVAYMPNPTQGRRLAAAIKRWRITIICSVPTFMRMLLRGSHTNQVTTLRMMISGAEHCPESLLAAWKKKVPDLEFIEGYGVTECAPILTLNPPGAPHCGVGIPIPGVTIKIIHPETHKTLEVNQEGLVIADGYNVFPGYLDPNTKSPFLYLDGRRWYNTGDLGYLDDKGYLYLVGRLKRFVKIGGEMVSLGAIEHTLQTFAKQEGWELVGDGPALAVCPQEGGETKTLLHLYTTFSLTRERANQLLREGGMSNLIKIASATEVPRIPLLGSGKIDYRSLSANLKKK